MSYRKFELLTCALGFVAVIGTTVFMMVGSSSAYEIAGQLLILPIIVSGLHFGRRGALMAFIACSAIYLILFGFLHGKSGPNTPAAIAGRIILFAGIGFLSAEMCERFSPYLTRVRFHNLVDSVTDLYNSRFLSRSIERSISQFDRYGFPFSLTTFSLNEEMLEKLERNARRDLIRGIGNQVIQINIRGSDEAARIASSKFAVLFHNTSFDEATYATIRLRSKILDYLSSNGISCENGEAVSTEILEYPRDREDIETMSCVLASREPSNNI